MDLVESICMHLTKCAGRLVVTNNKGNPGIKRIGPSQVKWGRGNTVKVQRIGYPHPVEECQLSSTQYDVLARESWTHGN